MKQGLMMIIVNRSNIMYSCILLVLKACFRKHASETYSSKEAVSLDLVCDHGDYYVAVNPYEFYHIEFTTNVDIC